jgi:hypothetical protein
MSMFQDVTVESTLMSNSFRAFLVGHLTTAWKWSELCLFSARAFSSSNSLSAIEISNSEFAGVYPPRFRRARAMMST